MFPKPKTPSGIDNAIEDVLSELKGFTSDTDEFAKMLEQLEKLHAMKVADKPCSVNPDTLAMIIGNLMGILLILEFERMNVITSKAMSFVSKLR